MFNLPQGLQKACISMGLALIAVAANAALLDGQISIDRALNSPTLTVRYTQAGAALVELRVNGESVATRAVGAHQGSGETTFNLNLSTLSNGENKIEIRLYDKAGRLLATEQTTITTDQTQGPVYLANPKMGATVRGEVDLKVGFGRELRNSYVSFFVDNQFKSISNVAPYSFTWDTTSDSNGWHEVEAWVVDESSTTFKTRKVRVFVNNPGGKTTRQGMQNAQKPEAHHSLANPVRATVGGASAWKPAQVDAGIPTGPKSMLPTGKRVATDALALNAAGNTGRITITRGQKLPNLGAFAIAYNAQVVNFDVQPRVTNGVPLTPFRHLIEKAGGKVDWANKEKNVSAEADGRSIFLHIGDAFAKINKQMVTLEHPSFLERGRTIVPLSFMREALDVNIEYDKATGHVLITTVKK